MSTVFIGSGLKRGLTHFFILWNLLVLATGLICAVKADLNSGRILAWPMKYVDFLGLHQFWNMFAPDPVTADRFLSVDIHFEHGEVVTQALPRTDDFFTHENGDFNLKARAVLLKMEEHIFLNRELFGPELARFFLYRVCPRGRGPKPLFVNVILNYRNLISPEQEWIRYADRFPLKYERRTILRYEVKDEDLR